MERINVYTENNDFGEREFSGWFDMSRAEEIASYKSGSPYTSGKILLATASGKLIVNSWNNTGYDKYRFADDEAEIAEILGEADYNGDDNKLNAILTKYEL